MKGLTDKQAKLVKGLAKGLKKQRAGQEAGYGTTPGSTSAIVTETLKIPKVQAALQPYLEKHNLTIDRALKPISEALDATEVKYDKEGNFIDQLPNHSVRLQASDRTMKLLGLQGENTGSFHLHLHNKSNNYKLD